MIRKVHRKARPSVRLWFEPLEDRLVPAPVGADSALLTLENQPVIIQSANFGYSDPLGPDSFQAVKSASLPTAGLLTDYGTPVTPGAFVPIADINAGALAYLPDPNAFGTPLDSLTFQVQDNGGTADGRVNIDMSPRTMTFYVMWVNQGPRGANIADTTLENQPYVFSTGDFAYSDPLDGKNFLAVKISSLPTGGELTDNGNAVTVGQYVPVSDITSNLLVYTPNPYGFGAAYDTFQFEVQNDGGTANGGIDTDPTPRTMTMNVTWVNQAPSFTASNPAPMVRSADADAVSIAGWADFYAGAPDQASQTATYLVTSVGDQGLFTSAPAVAPDGTLTFTVAPLASGTATFAVSVQNSGGTANNGRNTSAISTFTIEVENAPVQILVYSSADDGAGTLRQAVADASSGDTILFNLGNDSTIYLDSGISTSKNLTIDGEDTANNITIAQAPEGISTELRLLTFTGEDPVSETIRFITFEGGNATGYGNADPIGNIGGAIYVRGSLTLYRDTFVRNNALSGGAVAFAGVSAQDSLDIFGSTFTQNFAPVDPDPLGGPSLGGAIFAETGNILISFSSFERNFANSSGGAICAAINPSSSATFSVLNCGFYHNTAPVSGGAIDTNYNLSISGVLDRSTFLGNTSAIGGAISWVGAPINPTPNQRSLVLYGVLFRRNTASTAGGAVYASGLGLQGATIVESVSGCEFYSNWVRNGTGPAMDGGGLMVTNNTGGTASAFLAVMNSTF